jgi:tRNA G10  N-methylase Trm11
MLPPKLAQMMINLVPEFCRDERVVYDPFCGMGTVLQEGWLKGLHMVGSDKEMAMVEASGKNIDWVGRHFDTNQKIMPKVFLHDIQEALPSRLDGTFDAVVTEPYLGAPLTSPLSANEVYGRQKELQPLYIDFFKNIREALVENGWVVVVLPAFAKVSPRKRDYVLFPTSLVDDIESMGYICQYLAKGKRGLLYSRPDAYVAREITLWRKR